MQLTNASETHFEDDEFFDGVCTLGRRAIKQKWASFIVFYGQVLIVFLACAASSWVNPVAVYNRNYPRRLGDFLVRVIII